MSENKNLREKDDTENNDKDEGNDSTDYESSGNGDILWPAIIVVIMKV